MTFRGRDIQQEFYHYKPHTSVLQIIYERMAKMGSKIALVESWTGQKKTFDEVLENSTSITGELQSRGVTEGDNVLLCCDKSILAYSVLLATMFTGATAIVIHSQDADKIHLYVENQSVKAVFCDPIYMITVRDSVSQMSTPPQFLANIELDDPFFLLALGFQKKYTVFNVKDVKNHIPLVLFTSGSSGEPKGVQINDLFLQRLGYSFEDEYLYSYLLMGSFSWISSPISLISSIFKRYALILSNSNDPEYNLDLIQKYKVNGMTLNASRLAHFAKEPLLPARNLSSLVSVVIGGEVVLKRQALMFIDNVLKKRSGIQCVYGLTETGIITTWRYNDLTDYRKINSAGCVAPGVVIKILDDKGRTMPRMREGEVWVKSVAMMSGYWNKPPEVTSKLYNRNGFFRTGDAGYFDYDGFLYIKGRIKDMVDFRGTKMWVSDVEDILKCHPAVIEAAVIPKPDINNSYRLTAFVVKKPYFEVTGEEIVSFVGEQVDEDRQLRGGVHFIHELPRNSSSKVNRKRLQEMLE